jgi:aminoglycoside phosphotransferase (APT) family kinase protein
MSGGLRPRPVAEVDITEDLVRRLVVSERPDLAEDELVEVGEGWDNSVWRLGADLSVRVPRRASAVPLLVNEQRWLSQLAERLPLPVPVPLVAGSPTGELPWPWSICRWVPGRAWVDAPPADQSAAGEALGRFLRALHVPAPLEAPRSPHRGVSLHERDLTVRARARSVSGVADADALLELWDDVVGAGGSGEEMQLWVHGDLHPLNLACDLGALSGVLDFGDMTAGDPAVDLSVAWTVLDPRGRAALFDTYRPDRDAVRRAAGWALNHGLACVEGSADHPAVARVGEQTLARLLAAPPG